MAYSGWEVNVGEGLDQVATFCRHLLGNNTNFSDTTQPPLDEVELYFSNNYARMSGVLRRFGISPTQTDPHVLRLLMQYQVAYVCVDVEKTAASAGFNRVANPRHKLFEEKKDEFLYDLRHGFIQAMSGIVLIDSEEFYPSWTGSSEAEKAAIRGDSDRVAADITRDMMESNRVHSWNSNDERISEL